MLSDLTQVKRIDFTTGTGTLITSGYQGQWLVPGSTYATFPTSGMAGAFQIWTEGNRDGTAGFTPDATHTSKLTVLYGHYRAKTDRFNGVIGDYSIGTKLTVAADGDLTPARPVTVSGNFGVGATITPDHVYAVVVGIDNALVYFDHNSGTAFDAIEFVTV